MTREHQDEDRDLGDVVQVGTEAVAGRRRIAVIGIDRYQGTPWLRCPPEARRRLAATANIHVRAMDASLDARSASERRTWIEDVPAGDRHAWVSGWLFSARRRSAAGIPDLSTAPVQRGALLAIACDFACPAAVLIAHPTPDAARPQPGQPASTMRGISSCGLLPRTSIDDWHRRSIRSRSPAGVPHCGRGHV